MDPDRILLARLENAFEHHQKNEVSSIRELVSNYPLELAQDSKSPQIPLSDAIPGLRERYLEAVKANAAAKCQHVNAFKQSSQKSLNLENQSTKPTILSSRLELLREQERFRKLEILEHHVQKLRELSVVNAESPQWSNFSEQEGIFIHQLEIDPLVHDARAKLRVFEMALLDERYKAAREKDLLQSLRDPDRSHSVVTASDQLRALEAVRSELSTWLEDGLASCSTQETPNEAIQEASENESEETLNALQETYDAYLLSRVNISNAIRHTLVSEPLSTGPTIESNQERIQIPSVEDVITKFEQNISALQHHEGLQQTRSYLDGLLLEEEDGAVELMQRLADESQLLPSYPILSRSAKYGKTMGAVGTEKNVNNGDRVFEQTKAWEFAGDAANETTNESVRKHLKRGNQAIDEAQRNLKDMQSLRDATRPKP